MKYLINPSNANNTAYHKNDRGHTFVEDYDLCLATKKVIKKKL